MQQKFQQKQAFFLKADFQSQILSIPLQGSTTGTSAGSNETTTNGSKGGAKTYTAGIKWILNPNTRVLLNYSYTKFDTPFNPVDVNTTTTVGALGSNGTSTTAGDISNEKLLMLRTQFAF